MESEIHRKLAIVHYYTDWTRTFPTVAEQNESAGGRILYVDWTARIYGTAFQPITWTKIAEGLDDGVINREAAHLKAFDRPIMLSFQAEPDQASELSEFGSPQQYVAAWQRIYNLFRADGVKNVVWVWDVTGDPSANHRSPNSYGMWYPGDRYVDWIMWDPYNWYGCKGGMRKWKTFSQIVSPMYRWLTSHSGKPGNGNYLSKPWGLGEYGTVEGPNPTSKKQWLENAVTATEHNFPKLKALLYFDSIDRTAGRNCAWIVNSSRPSLNGYTAAGDNPYVLNMLAAGSEKPWIVMEPHVARATVDMPASFKAVAKGVPAPAVQWQLRTIRSRTWSRIGNGRTDVLTIPSVSMRDNGAFVRATFTNEYGSVSTRWAYLSVRARSPRTMPPRIIREPRTRTVRVGSRIVLEARATGVPKPKVQWQVRHAGRHDWRWLPHEILHVLVIRSATRADNGSQFRAVFRNGKGVATTRAVRVVVRPGRLAHRRRASRCGRLPRPYLCPL